MTLKVGDTLWYVDGFARRHAPAEDRGVPVDVIAVGRTWATLQPRGYPRIDMHTLLADGNGYSSPGRCYPSQEAYLVEVRTQKLWDAFHRHLRHRYSPPVGVTEQQIRQAAAALNLSLED